MENQHTKIVQGDVEKNDIYGGSKGPLFICITFHRLMEVDDNTRLMLTGGL